MDVATVRGRVVDVQVLRNNERFGVTLGPPPDLFWYETGSPPKLGAQVKLSGVQVVSRQQLVDMGGSVTVLRGGAQTIEIDEFQRRVVPQPWLNAMQLSTRKRLKPFQVEGSAWLAARLHSKQGSILADQPGLGKTIQVLCALVISRTFPALVVCPSHLKVNWVREASSLVGNIRCATVTSGRSAVAAGHIVVCSYEMLKTREAQLSRMGFKVVVFDEAHMLKEAGAGHAHRAAAATRVAHAIGLAIEMTGTPLLNRLQELWRLLHIVDPKEWPSLSDFSLFFAAKKKGEVLGRAIVTSAGQANHLDVLQARVMPYMLRRLKKHVLQELPVRERVTIKVELPLVERIMYDEADSDFRKWLQGVGKMTPKSRGEALLRMSVLRRIAAVGKVRQAVPEFLSAWFGSLGERRPMVIFAYHRQVVALLVQACLRAAVRGCVIRTEDDDVGRQQVIDQFSAGKFDVIIAPLKAAGEGLNLQHASDMLCLERLWSPALMDQAECRCDRLGQTRRVVVRYMDAERTVDQQIARVLAAKERLIDAVVDDVSATAVREQESKTLDEILDHMRAG